MKGKGSLRRGVAVPSQKKEDSTIGYGQEGTGYNSKDGVHTRLSSVTSQAGPRFRQKRLLQLLGLLCVFGIFTTSCIQSLLSSRNEEVGLGEDRPFEESDSEEDEVFISIKQDFKPRRTRTRKSPPRVGGDVCGHGWQSRYKELHQKYLSHTELGNRQPKFLTISRDITGLADALYGLGSSFLVSLFEKRALVIQHQCINEAFEPVEIKWRMTPLVPLPQDDLLLKSSDVLQGNVPPDAKTLRLFLSGNSSAVLLDPKLLFDPLRNVTNVVVTWNLGILARVYLDTHHPWGLRLRQSGIALPNMFGCFMRYVLRPTEKVKMIVRSTQEIMSEPSTRSICMHMRLTDPLVWNENGTQKRLGGRNLENAVRTVFTMFRCAEGLEKNLFSSSQGNVVWPFFSSSKHLKDVVKQLNPDKVLVTNIEPAHRKFLTNWTLADRQRTCRETAAEWFLLSKCNALVLPDLQRGFAKSAALYGLSGGSIYVANQCNYMNPIPFQMLANVSAHV